jgi:hypothetical protein
VEGARLLREIAEHELAIARVDRDEEAQLAEIREWAASERKLHEHEIAWRKARLQTCVDAELAVNPARRKSVPLPGGSAGYRTPPARLIVDDEAALLDWCRQHRPEWIRIPPPQLEKAPLKRDALEGGDGCLYVPGEEAGELVPIPGVRLERSEPVFYVSTTTGGTRT